MADAKERSTELIEAQSLQEAAEDIIKSHVLMSSAAGLFLPVKLEIPFVTGIQYRMVKKLAEVYDISFEEQEVRTVLSTLSFSAIAHLFSAGATALFNPNEKSGTWSESLTEAAVVGFFTGAVGKIYSLHFGRGGTLDGLGLDNFIELARSLVDSGELNPATIFSFSSRIWQSL
ncbi:MAG: DUF697 domain-containing protein [Phaeodactylibacter sp.]|nr:DUF697 domain-containing protein [Phaeodactylibacter sp.]